MSNPKDIIVKVRLLVKPPINVNNFYYKVTYTKFGYQNENGSHVSPKTINNALVKFKVNPNASRNGLLAIDSEEIVLLEHSNSIKRISFPDAKNGSAWFQIENRSNGKVVKKSKYPEWSYRYEREVSEYKWDTTSAKNSTTPDTKKTQQIKQKCPHTVDGAIEVAKYIVDEIKRNVRSLEAQRIRYHLTGEIGGKLKKSFNDIDASIVKVKAETGRSPYGYSRNKSTVTANELWVKQVNTGKDWDHKTLISGQRQKNLKIGEKLVGNSPKVKLNELSVKRPLDKGRLSTAKSDFFHKYKDYDYFYDIWSNIHYGYVGISVGFNEATLLGGSNLQQYASDIRNVTRSRSLDGLLNRVSSIGDTKDDYTTMQMGIQLASKFGKYADNLSYKDVLEVLEQTPSKPNISYSKQLHWCYDDKNPNKVNKP